MIYFGMLIGFVLGWLIGRLSRDQQMFEMWRDSDRRASMYFNRLVGIPNIRLVKEDVKSD